MEKRVDEVHGGGKVRPRLRAPLRVALLAFSAVSAAPAQLVGQFIPLGPAPETSVSLTLERPRLVRGPDFSTFVSHLFGTRPLRPNVGLAAGLSLVHARQSGLPASTIVSNAFLEVHFGGPDGYGAMTFTLPTSGRLVNTDAYGADAGFDADVERPERFTNGATGVAFTLHRRWPIAPLVVGARGGLAVSAPAGFRREFYARYGGFAEGSSRGVEAGVEVTGAAFLNSSRSGRSPSFSEISVHHATVYIGMPAVTLRPQLFARFPVDSDARRGLRSLYGVRVTY